MPNKIDALGQRFGRLWVIAMARMGDHAACICLCDCGREKTIRWSSLKIGFTRSCGCLASEGVAKRNFRHGDCTKGVSREWTVWHMIHQRCENTNNKAYRWYGGRGITVCERWNTFENFLSDMGRRPGPKMQIDRIDNDGNYTAGNCKWSTPKENSNNRRPHNLWKKRG